MPPEATETPKQDDAVADVRKFIRTEIAEALKDGAVKDGEEAEKVERQSFDKLQARIDALESEKAERSHSLPGAEDSTHKGQPYSFSNVFKAVMTGEFERDAPHEYAISRELFAQGTNVDTAGGFLVPTEVLEDQIIPLLRPQVIAFQLGIRTLNVTGAGAVELPRQTTAPATEAVAENEASSTTQIAFGNHRLEPRTAQSYIEASNRFLALGAGADMFIREQLANELALTQNLWILKGTGSNGEPIGILNSLGVNEVDFDSTVSSARVLPAFYKALLKMEDAIHSANAFTNAMSMGWAAAVPFIRACRQIESDNNSAGTTNLEMGRNIVTAGEIQRILDFRYERSTQLSAGSAVEAIFGDWSKVVLGSWNNLTIEASRVAGDALKKRQTHIVAYMDCDVAVTQPTAFAKAINCDLSSI